MISNLLCSLIYKFSATHELSRWVHFIAFALAVSIPVVARRIRTSVLVAVATVTLGISFELLKASIQRCAVSPNNVVADLFGAACGILLGMNIRVMRKPAQSRNDVIPITPQARSDVNPETLTIDDVLVLILQHFRR